MVKKIIFGMAVMVLACGLVLTGCSDPTETTTTYKVTFETQGGSAINPVTVDAGSSVNKPADPTKDGHTFDKWYNAASGGSEVTWPLTVNADVTVYARWVTTYKVTFNTQGGSAIEPVTVNAGSSVSKPADPTKDGYTFDKWYDAASGGSVVTWPLTVNTNITVYAQWNDNSSNGLAIDMIRVPGGSFSMGAEGVATPVHTVTLSAFYMGKYEITQGQWYEVMENKPSYFTVNPEDGSADGWKKLPVEQVSWYEVLVFCNKLSRADDLTPVYSISGSTNPDSWGAVPTSSNDTWNAVTMDRNASGYRLPTEAEWEYAARGGDGSPGNYTYAGSNTEGDVAWYSGNSNSKTHEVGKKQANGLDLYDMSGNVWEWCWDWYGSYSNTAQSDPAGASSGTYRVNRGGG